MLQYTPYSVTRKKVSMHARKVGYDDIVAKEMPYTSCWWLVWMLSWHSRNRAHLHSQMSEPAANNIPHYLTKWLNREHLSKMHVYDELTTWPNHKPTNYHPSGLYSDETESAVHVSRAACITKWPTHKPSRPSNCAQPELRCEWGAVLKWRHARRGGSDIFVVTCDEGAREVLRNVKYDVTGLT